MQVERYLTKSGISYESRYFGYSDKEYISSLISMDSTVPLEEYSDFYSDYEGAAVYELDSGEILVIHPGCASIYDDLTVYSLWMIDSEQIKELKSFPKDDPFKKLKNKILIDLLLASSIKEESISRHSAEVFSLCNGSFLLIDEEAESYLLFPAKNKCEEYIKSYK